MAKKQKSPSPALFPPALLFFLFFFFLPRPSKTQQLYTNNDMLDCYNKNGSSTLGYNCSNPSPTCSTYLLFRSQPNYNTPSQIAYFLNTSVGEISSTNGVNDVFVFPTDQLVLVPITCSCQEASTSSTSTSQHNAYYTLKTAAETYLTVANNTFQGLSTCQAMMSQNPDDDSYNLTVGLRLKVPLRCACPGETQKDQGYNFLLTYVVLTGDTYSTIAARFGVVIDDMLAANSLEGSDTIYPYTTLLLPLKTAPTKDMVAAGNTPSAVPSPPPVPPPPAASSSDDRWAVIIGAVVGATFIALCGLGVFYLCFRRRRKTSTPPSSETPLSSEARAVVGSLTVYSYSDLRKATGGFDNADGSDGSVFHGSIDGDGVAVKRVKGDGLEEVKILQRLNHVSLARLCGFCVHEGYSYLVYELAENGSLADWVDKGGLGWRKRIRIACELADGLNYLHHYTKPPCVHKDLSSGCVLLDKEFKVKLANFGLARSVPEEEDATPQQTWHVVGTMGYMPPEYLSHGLITPKIDVFAFGVVLLELLSGKTAVFHEEGKKKDVMLSSTIEEVVTGEDAREKLKNFLYPTLAEDDDVSMDSVFRLAEIAKQCVSVDPTMRPTMAEVFVGLSAVHSAVLDSDPSSERVLTEDSMMM